MKLNIFNIVDYYHLIIKDVLNENSVVVDCTCGNGNDTLFASNLMMGKGYIYAFDIQKIAVENTIKLLIEKSIYSNHSVINDSNTNLDIYIKEKIDLAIYNLGYLPNSVSKISTNYISTIKSLEIVLNKLKVKGIVIIAAYLGHDNCMERDGIYDFLSKLDDKTFKVLNHKIINLKNYPPELFIIQKMHDS